MTRKQKMIEAAAAGNVSRVRTALAAGAPAEPRAFCEAAYRNLPDVVEFRDSRGVQKRLPASRSKKEAMGFLKELEASERGRSLSQRPPLRCPSLPRAFLVPLPWRRCVRTGGPSFSPDDGAL